jgi:hypothetical protein
MSSTNNSYVIYNSQTILSLGRENKETTSGNEYINVPVQQIRTSLRA